MIEYKSVWCHRVNQQALLNDALWDGWMLMGTTHNGDRVHMVFERVLA